ncbi:uncharacterized protein RJT20DRAFT_135119 [Scheffersomyces xylosifermentans]|uniref:uncharacterized protein n=1 Tax=Scheffersomyces xylosifermentans TaxID=1304137 RepID=UPI00315C532D
MTTAAALVQDEIVTIEGLLSSIPFTAKSQESLSYFLNIYKLNYRSLQKLNDQPFKFPIESSKVLKLGISLGNLIKTLQLDEETYEQQNQEQKSFINAVNSLKSPAQANPAPTSARGPRGAGSATPTQEYNPFNPQTPKNNLSSPAPNGAPATPSHGGHVNQPPYQIKFMTNLLIILKNFDIGSSAVQVSQNGPNSFNNGIPNNNTAASINSHNSDLNSTNLKLHEMTTSHSTSTLTSHGTNGTNNSSNASPIKLSSKQLLIEKLEINIKLDNILIYRVLLKLILQVLGTLQLYLGNSADSGGAMLASPSSIGAGAGGVDYAENSSIFSSNSLNTNDSRGSLMTMDEYVRIIQSIVSRISAGIIEPFIRLIIVELVENNVQHDFNKLVNSL